VARFSHRLDARPPSTHRGFRDDDGMHGHGRYHSLRQLISRMSELEQFEPFLFSPMVKVEAMRHPRPDGRG